MRAEPFDLVIFECDGVLVDSEPVAMRVLLETLAEAGLKLDPRKAHDLFLGRSLATISKILGAEYGVHLGDGALDRMRLRLYDAFRRELRPIPGVEIALDGIEVRRCVASSSQVERIRLSLEITGLLARFEPHIFSASMVARGKQAPDLFLHAAEQMGVVPGRCLVVEDSPAGITAAIRAEMRVCAFAGGAHAIDEAHRAALRALAPWHLLDDMRRLPDLVKSSGTNDTDG